MLFVTNNRAKINLYGTVIITYFTFLINYWIKSFESRFVSFISFVMSRWILRSIRIIFCKSSRVVWCELFPLLSVRNKNKDGTSVCSLGPTTMQGGVTRAIKIIRRSRRECLMVRLHVLGRWSGDKFWLSFKAYLTFYKKLCYVQLPLCYGFSVACWRSNVQFLLSLYSYHICSIIDEIVGILPLPVWRIFHIGK